MQKENFYFVVALWFLFAVCEGAGQCPITIESRIADLETKANANAEKIAIMDDRLRAVEKQINRRCDVSYNGKCFTYIYQSAGEMHLNAGRDLCTINGFELANIYDQAHYELIVDYLRTKGSSSSTAVTAWLGMTFNQATQTALNSDGTAADVAASMWYPGYPKREASHTVVAMHIERDAGVQYQGIHTWSPQFDRMGSVCEF